MTTQTEKTQTQNTQAKKTLPSQTAGTASTGAPAGAKVVIAVDGPAASGKGTLAKRLAARLGYAYLDTGALYRAIAFTVLDMQGDPQSIEEVMPAVTIVSRNLTPELLENPALRTAEVGAAASKVAALSDVRAALVDYQRNFAKNPPGNVGGAVLDGRDIGTVICPDADVKLYVTAGVRERAMRRFEELRSTGTSFDRVLADLEARDLRDSTRAAAPAIAAEDAYTIDTTRLGIDDMVDEAVAIVRARFLAKAAL